MRDVNVLEEQEGQANEVVAVEVGDEDDLDLREGDAQALELG